MKKHLEYAFKDIEAAPDFKYWDTLEEDPSEGDRSTHQMKES